MSNQTESTRFPQPSRVTVLASAAVALCLLVAGGWFYRSQERQMRRAVENQILAVAELKARELSAWLGERMANARMTMVSAAMTDEVVACTATPGRACAHMLAFMRGLEASYGYADVVLVDAAGVTVLDLAGGRQPPCTLVRERWTAALRESEPTLVDLHRDTPAGPPHLEIIAPISAPATGARGPVAGIVLRVDVTRDLYPMIQSWPLLSRSGEIVLVRREGDHVLFLNELRHRSGTALRLRLPLSQWDVPAAMVVQGLQGMVTGVDYRGVDVLAALRPIPHTPWFLEAKVDSEEALAQWHFRSALILAVIAALLVSTVAVAGLLLHRIQRDHYRALHASEVARGESEERYRTTLLSIGDGVITTDADGRVTLLNPVAATLTGWGDGEAAGRPVEEVFHIVNEESRDEVESPVRRVIREGAVVGLANHSLLLARSGSEHPIADSGAPIRSADGLLRGVVLVFRDQTTERAAAAALQESERRFREMVEKVKLIVVHLDTEGRIVFCNDHFLRTTGWRREEVEGREWFGLVIPSEQRAAVREVFAAAMRTGEVEAHYVNDIVTRDGQRRRVEWNNIVLRDIQGRVAGTSSIAEDVTEQVRAEMALRQSEEKYRTVADLTYDWEYWIAPDGALLYCSPACERVSGYSREELEADPRLLTELVHPDDREPVKRHFSDHLGDQVAVCHLDFRIQGRHGERWIAHSCQPVFGSDGAYLGRRGSNRDITDRRAVEERLRQAEKMDALGQLAGGVAHDFNNQLSGMMGYAEMLSTRLEDPTLRRYAENIVRSATRAADLTEQLLAFARRGRYLSLPTNIHKVIGEVVELLRRSIDKRIEIHQHLDADPPIVRGDPTQIQSAILNLALNARDAMPGGGTLVFSTRVVDVGELAVQLGVHPGRYVELGVADNGVGMDAATKARLFEPFFTTKEPGKGTGLGLAAVYGAVKGHGGGITVQSEPGRGSTFSIFLPLAKEPARENVASAEAVPATRGAARILVVDDEEVIRNLAVHLLSGLGYEVSTCADGSEAVEAYRRSGREIDLVILDLMMPRMSGRETFLALKEIDPEVKVVVCSGYSLEGEAQGVLDAGALGFVAKPFRKAQLSQAVAAALAGPTQPTPGVSGSPPEA